MVAFQIVPMQKNHLRRLMPEQFARELFIVVENSFGVFQECGDDLLLKCRIAGAAGGGVDWGGGPIFRIERDGGDAVNTIGEEGFNFLARLEGATGLEKKMAEETAFYVFFRNKRF